MSSKILSQTILLFSMLLCSRELWAQDSLPSRQPMVGDTEKDSSSSLPKKSTAESVPDNGSDEPSLPTGLDDENDEAQDEPSLPSGLDDENTLGSKEPSLPSGLNDENAQSQRSSNASEDGFQLPFQWRAFIDFREGGRIHKDLDQQSATLGEIRFQLQAERSFDFWSTTLSLTTDFIWDPVLTGRDIRDTQDFNFGKGQGPIDLRKANIVMSPFSWMDMKLGRQALTWGTGDLVFINDMFPKDWNAFLIGRDMEYLKAPSDALKTSLFLGPLGIDIVYTPRFDADRFPDRQRLSSWDPLSQNIVGQSSPLSLQNRGEWAQDDEWAGRISGQAGGVELALYGYNGFWKSPAGFDRNTAEATFPQLSVYGASARRAMLGGIANLEGGYYYSKDDPDGDNLAVRNSEIRGTIGFEREALSNLSVGAQYYFERILDYQNFTLPFRPGSAVPDKTRHLLTLRMQYLMLNQTLRLGLFAFYSPNEKDSYLMPTLHYSLDDHWSLGAGANIFDGQDKYTFFGQLKTNSNVYGFLRATW